MKLGVTILLSLAGCGSCQPSQPATSLTDQQIATELVEAGCLANDDTAVPAVHAERALNPPAAWMDCIASGGSVTGCQVPCSR